MRRNPVIGSPAIFGKPIMKKYVLRRLIISIPVLFLVSGMIFSLIHLIPGDPIDYLFADETLTPEIRDQYERDLGLDRPLVIQYATWLGKVFRGDLGMSIQMGRPILDLIWERVPATLLLALAAILVSVLIAIPVGIIAAVKRHTSYDYLFMTSALVGISIPHFWLGILLILFFSVFLDVLPSSGYRPLLSDPMGSLEHLVLPSITLGTGMAAIVARMTRSEMLEEIGKEYVRTARAKGMPEGRVIFRHILKNALVPTITILGIQFGRLMGGMVVVEHVFAWPGLGSLVVDAVYSRDYPMVQALVLTFAVIAVSVNMAVDILYKYVNPRITLE
jgi:peptide/nickel transport system permease protein